MASLKLVTIKSSSTQILLLSILIPLSAASSAIQEESRQCYWCGPLAEQVHKSQRAAPCASTNNYITTCDPGYPYCAIVATSPPHVESRYCVKLYQDECYHVYCNTTRTWKMTCPCQGDLCNGPKTNRESEAFQIMSKLVAKTHKTPIKKRAIEETMTGIQTENISNIKTQEINMMNPTHQENKPDLSIVNNKTPKLYSNDSTPLMNINDTASINIKMPQTDPTVNTIRELTTFTKTNAEMPTAEALQDNAAVTENSVKTTELTTETTTISVENIELTTGAPTKSKNHASPLEGSNVAYVGVFYVLISLEFY